MVRQRQQVLWDHENLATLRSFASVPGLARRRLPDESHVEVERWTARFPASEPPRLPQGVLKKTYTLRPLVAPFGRGLFGEIATLRCLERDGWSGV